MWDLIGKLLENNSLQVNILVILLVRLYLPAALSDRAHLNCVESSYVCIYMCNIMKNCHICPYCWVTEGCLRLQFIPLFINGEISQVT